MTDAELVILKTRISQAENSYHSLMTGQMAVVVVDQNGEKVEFNKVSADKLYTYIAWLKGQLPDVPVSAYAGPIRYFF